MFLLFPVLQKSNLHILAFHFSFSLCLPSGSALPVSWNLKFAGLIDHMTHQTVWCSASCTIMRDRSNCHCLSRLVCMPHVSMEMPQVILHSLASVLLIANMNHLGLVWAIHYFMHWIDILPFYPNWRLLRPKALAELLLLRGKYL